MLRSRKSESLERSESEKFGRYELELEILSPTSQPWFKDPDLRDWLHQDSGNEDFRNCKGCRITPTNASKSMLLRHKDSDRHKGSLTKLYSLARFVAKRFT